jgi:predicted nucleic acid-binding protein
MVLVDTSVWVDHFARSSTTLMSLLDKEKVCTHPFVIGELACGNLQNRKELLSLLDALPAAPKVADPEILFYIEHQRLFGKGIGLVDIHLLASSQLMRVTLWTRDKRLRSAAKNLHVAFDP